jgi:Aldehyde dehydrogenase family
VENPATGEIIAHVPAASEQDVDAAVAAACAALSGPWARMSGRERLAILLRTADMIEARALEGFVKNAGDDANSQRSTRVTDSRAGVIAASYPTLGGFSQGIAGQQNVVETAKKPRSIACASDTSGRRLGSAAAHLFGWAAA